MRMLSADEWQIILLSLRVSIVGVMVALPLAFGVAWLLSRGRFRGKLVLDALVHLPLVVPPVVVGWALLIVFSPSGWGGLILERLFGMTVLFRWTGAAIAAAVMALPLMVRAIRLSLDAVDRRLEDAARTLGARPWRAFSTITLPLSLPGVAAAIVLGFARSLGEFGATITFVSNVPGETRTLPIAIYTALQVPGGDHSVIRLALISCALAFGALLASELLTRRSSKVRYVL